MPAASGAENRGLAPAPVAVGERPAPQRATRSEDGPVVDIYAPGAANKQVVLSKAAVPTSTQVLKHGFPGEQCLASISMTVRLYCLLCYLGPIPDILRRTAYVAAYDRRLKHPAWVRANPAFSSVSANGTAIS